MKSKTDKPTKSTVYCEECHQPYDLQDTQCELCFQCNTEDSFKKAFDLLYNNIQHIGKDKEMVSLWKSCYHRMDELLIIWSDIRGMPFIESAADLKREGEWSTVYKLVTGKDWDKYKKKYIGSGLDEGCSE